MAKSRVNKYQYETSPRKLEPDYTRPRKNKKVPKKNVTKKPIIKQKEKISSTELGTKKLKRRTILYIILGFAIVFGISYRNAQIDESFMKIQSLKGELAQIQKDNSQMQVKLENSLNLKKVEAQAKKQLGMQRRTQKQTVYVNLPKTEYIEPATEQVVIKEESGLSRIISQVMNIFK